MSGATNSAIFQRATNGDIIVIIIIIIIITFRPVVTSYTHVHECVKRILKFANKKKSTEKWLINEIMQTLRINNNQSAVLLMSLVDGHCVLLEPIGWLCPQSDCPPSVTELFRLPPLKSGTLHRNISSRLPRCSPSGVTWKRIHYNNLSAYNTLVDLVVALVTLATLKNQINLSKQKTDEWLLCYYE